MVEPLMTQAVAMDCVRKMMIHVQKARSVLMEAGQNLESGRLGVAYEDTIDGVFNTNLHPWLFGDKCVLGALEVILNRGSVTAAEFFNLMWIAQQEPQISVFGDLPEPDLNWIKTMNQTSPVG